MNTTPFDLTGKVAVVTGTSRGLGQYLGRALARAGADLVITSREPATLAPFRAEVEALGRCAFPLPLDVRRAESIQAMVEAAVAHYGKIDILVDEDEVIGGSMRESRVVGQSRAGEAPLQGYSRR